MFRNVLVSLSTLATSLAFAGPVVLIKITPLATRPAVGDVYDISYKCVDNKGKVVPVNASQVRVTNGRSDALKVLLQSNVGIRVQVLKSTTGALNFTYLPNPAIQADLRS